MIRTLYDAIGVSRTASKKDIEAACLRLGEQLRPDKNESAEAKARFVTLSQAYEILLDDQRRSEYDRDLNEFESNQKNEKISAQRMEVQGNQVVWGAILLLIGIATLLIQFFGYQLRIVALITLFGISPSLIGILFIVAGVTLLSMSRNR